MKEWWVTFRTENGKPLAIWLVRADSRKEAIHLGERGEGICHMMVPYPQMLRDFHVRTTASPQGQGDQHGS
jgi:hypothetical protein